MTFVTHSTDVDSVVAGCFACWLSILPVTYCCGLHLFSAATGSADFLTKQAKQAHPALKHTWASCCYCCSCAAFLTTTPHSSHVSASGPPSDDFFAHTSACRHSLAVAAASTSDPTIRSPPRLRPASLSVWRCFYIFCESRRDRSIAYCGVVAIQNRKHIIALDAC